MDLSVFDFRDDFTLHEIASLCAGHDPGSLVPDESDAVGTDYRELIFAATASATMANAECALAHFAGRTRPSLSSGRRPLAPCLSLRRASASRRPSARQEWSWAVIGCNAYVLRQRRHRRRLCRVKAKGRGRAETHSALGNGPGPYPSAEGSSSAKVSSSRRAD